MKFNIKIDEAALRRALRAPVNSAVTRIAREHTDGLAALRQRYVGQPIESIKPALVRQFKRTGGNITEPQLTEWAQMISDGRSIVVKPGKEW